MEARLTNGPDEWIFRMEYFDENSLHREGEISFRFGSFTGARALRLLESEWQNFLNETETLITSPKAGASLMSVEERFQLFLRGNGRGGVEVSGEIGDLREDGTLLRYRFETEQTYLRAFLDAVRAG